MKEWLLKGLLVLMLIVAMMFTLGVGPFSKTYTVTRIDKYYCEDGDTLWDIGCAYQGQTDISDVREYIYKIRKFNGLDGRTGPILHKGDIILVPIYKIDY